MSDARSTLTPQLHFPMTARTRDGSSAQRISKRRKTARDDIHRTGQPFGAMAFAEFVGTGNEGGLETSARRAAMGKIDVMGGHHHALPWRKVQGVRRRQIDIAIGLEVMGNISA